MTTSHKLTAKLKPVCNALAAKHMTVLTVVFHTFYRTCEFIINQEVFAKVLEANSGIIRGVFIDSAGIQIHSQLASCKHYPSSTLVDAVVVILGVLTMCMVYFTKHVLIMYSGY